MKVRFTIFCFLALVVGAAQGMSPGSETPVRVCVDNLQKQAGFSSLSASKGLIVVSGPFSSAKGLRDAIVRRGYTPVSLRSKIKPPDGYSLDENLYFANRVIETEGEDAILDDLAASALPVAAVIDASEAGVLDGNRARRGLARRGIRVVGSQGDGLQFRDKRVFYTKLRNAGVPIPDTFWSSDVNQVVDWARKRRQWPVVVKPPLNAGGCGIRFCFNVDQVRKAFHAIMNAPVNGMQLKDDEVIVQEFLDDKEQNDPFQIETAFNGGRTGGRSFYTGFFRYDRELVPGAGNRYLEDLLLRSGEVSDLQLDTVERALDALEMHDGIFHIELKCGKVVDVGMRFSGGGLPFLEKAATDRDPFELALDIHLNPQALVGLPRFYTRLKHAAPFFVSTDTVGAKASHRLKPALEKWKRDGRILDFEFFFEDKEDLPITLDSDSMVAKVLVLDASVENFQSTLEKLRQWKTERRFESPP